jgi:hypothetical protein
MRTVKCRECGEQYYLKDNENASNFECQCGGKLKEVITNDNGFIGELGKQGTGIKLLGVVGLLIIFGIIIVGLGGMGNSKETQTSPVAPIENTTNTPVQASWHNLITFTGKDLTIDDNTPTFTTKGNQFKVIVDADSETGSIKHYPYSTLVLTVKSKNSNAVVGSGELKDFTSEKNKGEYTIYAEPGEYYISISKDEIKDFQIQIVDYY